MNCASCLSRSFASYYRAQYWHPTLNGLVTPRSLCKNSTKKGWFQCSCCGHAFEATLNTIVNSNTWCPYCGHQKLCDSKSCQSCFNRSFASSDRIHLWNPSKNTIDPRFVTKHSHEKCWFLCENGHEFEMSLDHISNGTCCRYCRNKTEAKLLAWLKKHYVVSTEITFIWCVKTKRLPFDFFIPELGLFIELDGRQHFVQVKNWGSIEDIQENDVYKMKCILEHGYSMIRIKQEDVWYDRYDWKALLSSVIKKYEIPCIIPIGPGYEFYYHQLKAVMEIDLAV